MTSLVGDVNFIQRRLRRQRAYLERIQETPHLKCIRGDVQGAEAWIEETPFKVGRAYNTHLSLPDPAIALLHGELRRAPNGDYLLVAHAPETAPVYVREGGRYAERSVILLEDKARVRLGEVGPVFEFRYLGGDEARRSVALSVLRARRADPLLPVPHLIQRLDEQRFSATTSGPARYFMDQAVRYLDQLHFYRRWIVIWALTLLTLGGLVIHAEMGRSFVSAELDAARSQLRSDALGARRQAATEDPAQSAPEGPTLLEEDRIARGMYRILTEAGVQNPTLDRALVALVKTEIDRESKRLRRRFDLEKFLARHQRYNPRIQEIFQREYQLPPSLAYIAWVESDYTLDAESPVGALGMWQFMEPTALYYGLVTPTGEDHRLSFERSTHAAAQMFSDLLAQFGQDRLLVAIAAYNWGPRRIAQLQRTRRLRRPEERTFTHMLKMFGTSGEPVIPEETRAFVARYFATQLIDTDLAFYLGE